MLREKNIIYIKTSDGTCHEFKRPKKNSEQIAEYEAKIRRIRAVMAQDDRLGMVNSDRRSKQLKEIAHLEKLIENLQKTPHSKKLKHSYKKIEHDKLKNMVMQKINEAKVKGAYLIQAENIAFEFNVKPQFVHQIFQELNVEGILSQAIHDAPHDNPRNHFAGGSIKGWASDYYRIVDKEE